MKTLVILHRYSGVVGREFFRAFFCLPALPLPALVSMKTVWQLYKNHFLQTYCTGLIIIRNYGIQLQIAAILKLFDHIHRIEVDFINGLWFMQICADVSCAQWLSCSFYKTLLRQLVMSVGGLSAGRYSKIKGILNGNKLLSVMIQVDGIWWMRINHETGETAAEWA